VRIKHDPCRFAINGRFERLAFPRVDDATRRLVSRRDRMLPALDRVRSVRLIGVAAAVLALMLLERASAQQPGGAATAPPPAAASAEPIDRARILTAPNVFGVFVTCKVHPAFDRMGNPERKGVAAE
jgi:hypothetical protein